MKQYDTEAILLAVRDFGSADRMVTLFSKEYGKLKAVAYGARRMRSSLAGCVQPFCHVKLVLFPGKSLDSIRQCDTVNSFKMLKADLILMAYASFIVELADEFMPEKEPNQEVFYLLFDALNVLTVRNPRITILVYAWKLLALSGYKPEYKKCLLCGQKLSFPVSFDVSAGGAVCSKCKHNEILVFSETTAQLLDKIFNMDFANPGQFSINGAILNELEAILIKYLLYHLEKPLKSLAFIQKVTAN